MSSIFADPVVLAEGDPEVLEGVKKYTGPPLTQAMVAKAEETLEVRLPAAYVDLLRTQNGGYLREPSDEIFDELEHHVGEIMGIGYPFGIDSAEEIGGIAMKEEWGYPEGTVWLSGDGHTGFFLDYRECGPQGEPPVVSIDVEDESDTQVSPVAPDFVAFLQMIDAALNAS